jgi:hypothetical protein
VASLQGAFYSSFSGVFLLWDNRLNNDEGGLAMRKVLNLHRVAIITFSLTLLLALAQTASATSATGGDVTTNGGYRIHTFTNNGAFDVLYGGNVEVLVVAGGGGGGSDMGGGGGGGGLIYSNTFAVFTSNYAVKVGVGGAGAPAGASQPRGSNGSNSVFSTLIAIGGGGGGSEYANANSPAGSGGSGGGGVCAANPTKGLGTPGQGYDGAVGYGTYYPGGGGGAGSSGSNNPAHGGIGRAFSINGTSYYYAGGGGGSGYSTNGGNGGNGGGGGGAIGVTTGGSGINNGSPGGGGAQNSVANTNGGNAGASTGGGGGGGSHHNLTNKGGNGGSGIVIVRYSLNPIIANLPATNITSTSACLNGFISSIGDSPVTVSVYYGDADGGDPTSGLWKATNTWAEGEWGQGSYPTYQASGLTANRIYCYRYYATNAVGQGWASSSERFLAGNVTVSAPDAMATEPAPGWAATDPGVLTIERDATATNEALTVYFAMNGTAGYGVDYSTLPLATNVTLPIGVASTNITIVPFWNTQWSPVEPTRTAWLTLLPGAYEIGTPSSNVVTIAKYPVTAGINVTTNAGNWNNGAIWSLGRRPVPGDDVTVKHAVTLADATDMLSSFTITNATLTFTNYAPGVEYKIQATNVIVLNGGVITHVTNTATSTNTLGQWIANSRVWIVCTNLTVATGGKIHGDSKGYGPDAGPGRGFITDNGYAGGAGYGGRGGQGSGVSPANPPGVAYGSAAVPVDPGSGGGRPTGGRGGGLIWIEATARVLVNGTISTTGGDGNGGGGGSSGSGGGIYIRCLTIAGTNSTVSANAGGNSFYGCAGGGRIAVQYDTTAQGILNATAKPTITFTANAGLRPSSAANRGRPGSLWFSDATVYPLGFTSLQGGELIIPGFVSWAPASLTVSNGLALFPSGFLLTTTNNLTLAAGLDAGIEVSNGLVNVGSDLNFNGGQSDIYGSNVVVTGNLNVPGGKNTIWGGLKYGNTTNWTMQGVLTLSLTNQTVNIPANLAISGGGVLTFSNAPYNTPMVNIASNLTLNIGTINFYSASTNSATLNIGGNLVMTNTGSLYVYGGVTNSAAPFGAQVIVAGNTTVSNNSWIYPYSHSTNGGSPIFRMQNLTISGTNAGFNANSSGFAGGNGPGRGTITGGGWAGGGAYGGAGANGSTGIGGQPYGSSNTPIHAGSAGGRAGDRGGGLVRLEVAKTATINGTITANGVSWPSTDGGGGGGGAGGGIYLVCKTLVGTNGFLTANGGSASTANGGGGGGGRIAIWRQTDLAAKAGWTTTVNGGIAKNNGGPGTIVWGQLPVAGSLIIVK